MPEWCPKCNAMLPEGLDRCPRCGKKLRSSKGDEYSFKDVLGISSQVLVIILIPVVLIVVIGLLCTILGN
jgi:predicted amidophosphoribosyltransferase